MSKKPLKLDDTPLEKLVDVYIDAPKGVKPERIHILFNTETRANSDAYADALKIARGIPFNLNAIPVTDALVLIISNVLRIKDGTQAIQVAKSYYEKWSYEILQMAWVLALVEDNDFVTPPTPYAPKTGTTLKGMVNIPEPQPNLAFPVEYRLKQLQDYLASSPEFHAEVMAKINNAFAELVQIGDDETNVAGFHSTAANSSRDDENVANDATATSEPDDQPKD